LKLLFEQKFIHKTLPNLSDKLGENILTNSEMIAGVGGAPEKLNHGVAISRVFNPDENTHIELCKYPDGSGAMMRLGVMAAGDGNGFVRTAKMLGNMILHPIDSFRFFFETNVAKEIDCVVDYAIDSKRNENGIEKRLVWQQFEV
jgi:cholesterol oxidase